MQPDRQARIASRERVAIEEQLAHCHRERWYPDDCQIREQLALFAHVY
jgi:hypothetical protein